MISARLERAAELPDGWDALAENAFQRREFLLHCERENPCRQRYHVLQRGDRLVAGAVVYSLPVNLLTFLGVRSPLSMQIVGVPCSVASSGVVGERDARERLLRDVLARERGLVLALNLDAAPPGLRAASGRTWPGVVLENRFRSLEDYRRALRAPYRRRLDAILRHEAELAIETGPCAGFTDEMHRMYLAVLDRSEGRLERLGPGFFRTLPAAFRLTTFRRDGRLCAWVTTLADGERFWFFLGGQAYGGDARAVYLVMLLAVLRQGIAAGARTIDLGQSAEVPKLRLGGAPQEKVMLGAHHHGLVTGLLRVGAPALSYRRRHPPAHVFGEVRA